MSFELTDGQIAEWTTLAKLQNKSRTWSVAGLSPQEAKKRQDALCNYPKVMMQTEEGRAGMNALIQRIFYESDSQNRGSLTGQDFRTLFEKLHAHHDTLPGIMGHWVIDKTVFTTNMDWQMKHLGTNGRITFDRLMETWGIYSEKILPNLKDKQVFTDEQISEMIRVMKLQMKAKKWSVEGLSPQEAKKRQDALENYPMVMMQCEEGRAALNANMEKMFYDSDSQNMGSITGYDLWTMVEKMGAHHDTLPGIMGHWIEDKELWFQNNPWFMKTFGTDGRFTFDQLMAVYGMFFEKVLPHLKDKPLELTDAQIAEWIRLNKLQNKSRKWSGLSPQEARKRQDALEELPKQMMQTEQGLAEMNAMMANMFYECDSENMGSLTGQDLWTLFEKMNAIYDTVPGIMGHWNMDKTVWDESMDWFMKTLGTDGRITFDQWLYVSQIWHEKVLLGSKVKPIELTDVQIAEWVMLVKSQNAVRTWSVQGLSPRESRKRQKALDDYPNVAMQTEMGQAKMMTDMENIFYQSDSEKMGSLGAQDFWPWYQKYCAWQDTLPGVMGHWNMPKSEWDKFTVWYMKNLGTDGRNSYDQFLVSFQAYNEKVVPMSKDKPVELTGEQIAEWSRLDKQNNLARKWSVEGLSPQEAKRRQKALDDHPMVMMSTEKGLAQFMDDIERIFYESDSENMGSITLQDFWTWIQKFGAYHDTLPGIMGHWVMNKTDFDKCLGYVVKLLGTNGRMTYDQFLQCFQIYQMKILPLSKE